MRHWVAAGALVMATVAQAQTPPPPTPEQTAVEAQQRADTLAALIAAEQARITAMGAASRQKGR
jgi:hypothetical protein